ncbi:MAG: endonuclease/exonuclease/phosphatase family protein [Clostridia bacterium]|nr:endonuclease/exonuclease/phosphatase family protein [Clostridia bacterium]
MYFKLMQKIVAFFVSIIAMFGAQTPTTGIDPTLPLKNVNPNPIVESAKTQDLTIMTYNVKIRGDGLRANEKRLPLIVDTIVENAPDSFGLQEADKDWVESIAAGLSDYAYIAKYRDDGISEGESTAIFYLKDKYELVKSGFFWLSETPDVPSLGWDAACNRITSYAILKDKTSGFTYAHFNTHLDHVGNIAQAESIALISAKIAEIAPDIPVVLTGDFNFSEGTYNYKTVLKTGLKDTKYLAKEYDDHATYHGYHVVMPDTKPIDYVFVNGYVASVKSSKINSDFTHHIFASDHFPITVEMTLFNGGTK